MSLYLRTMEYPEPTIHICSMCYEVLDDITQDICSDCEELIDDTDELNFEED